MDKRENTGSGRTVSKSEKMTVGGNVEQRLQNTNKKQATITEEDELDAED